MSKMTELFYVHNTIFLNIHFLSLFTFHNSIVSFFNDVSVETGITRILRVLTNCSPSLIDSQWNDKYNLIFFVFLSSEDIEDNEAKLPAARVYPPADNQLLPMPPPVSSVLYGPLSALYIREAVCACREVTVSIAPIVDVLVQVTFLCSERNNLCQNCLKCLNKNSSLLT